MLRSLLLALVALACTGCAWGPASPGGRPAAGDVGPGLLTLHVSYSAAFEALKGALDSDELLLARSTIRQLRGRLARDLRSAPTLAEARGRTDEVATRTLSGELPSRESVEAALELVDRFESIVDGRERLGAVTLDLELRRVPGEARVEVWLRGRSRWPEPLTVRPFAVSLVVRRLSVDQKALEVNWSDRLVLEDAVGLDLPAGGEHARRLLGLPIEVPRGAMATRMRVSLACTGGEVVQGADHYPAREVAVSEAERTDIAGWIPTGLIEPGRLVGLVEEGRGNTEVLLECAIRIDPARRDEALDGLGRAVQTLPDEALRPIVPAARWLLGVEGFGRDERAWKELLAERYARRLAAGEVRDPRAER